MKEKFIRKYMRYAKAVAEDQNPCLSRAIGAVIVHPEKNVVISTGYNGPAKDIPHPDTFEFLKDYVYPQLTNDDKKHICDNHAEESYRNWTSVPVEKEQLKDFMSRNCEKDSWFAKTFEGCKTCPRKLVGAISGARLELCGCAHGERNAIANAAKAGHETFCCYMFCWCGVPCLDCCVSIINSGITKVFCIKDEVRQNQPNAYNFNNSRWQFKKAGVEVVELDKEWVLKDD